MDSSTVKLVLGIAAGMVIGFLLGRNTGTTKPATAVSQAVSTDAQDSEQHRSIQAGSENQASSFATAGPSVSTTSKNLAVGQSQTMNQGRTTDTRSGYRDGDSANSATSDPQTGSSPTVSSLPAVPVASTTRAPVPINESHRPFFDSLTKRNGQTLAETHAQLENEEEDYAWAYQMKLQLTHFFAQMQARGPFIEVRVLECRTTLCEVQAVSAVPPMDSRWKSLMDALPQQPWQSQLTGSFDLADFETGSRLLMLLRRKE